jgi:hypothetical protein
MGLAICTVGLTLCRRDAGHAQPQTALCRGLLDIRNVQIQGIIISHSSTSKVLVLVRSGVSRPRPGALNLLEPDSDVARIGSETQHNSAE